MGREQPPDTSSIPTRDGYLAGVSLDNDVAALADLTGFRGDSVRRTSVRAGEVVVVQLVLRGHRCCRRGQQEQKVGQGLPANHCLQSGWRP